MSKLAMEGKPLISIVSINFNQLAVTFEMLESIRQQDYQELEVIIVDNASHEDPTLAIQQKYPEVTVIRSSQNLGFSGGNNLGINAAKGDYIFLVNNDTELTEGLIEKLVARFKEVPDLGIVSPLICYEREEGRDDIIQYAGASRVSTLTARNQILGEGQINQGQYKLPEDTAYVHGAAMMIPRSVIEKVGNMPELFFLYYEELDWCEQIRRAGFRIQVEPRALIYHKESVSTGKASPMKTFYLTRNRILFMRRNRGNISFSLFFLFFSCITLPRWIATYALHGEWPQLKAFLKAYWWHYTQKDSTFVTGSFDSIDPVLSPAKTTIANIQSRA